ncbi:hypothetical protein LOK49_LG02G03640 [Camellia lanceoleosa]|uniref:Uncharacterized protein n=1 Tax=Camellia lanceoleosa TaxID=1840588 RepID=A0ACC0INU2_9ERIC|nr:hypothetical protein LOK49_LG02G03640 [Camellia lanceoleosa]
MGSACAFFTLFSLFLRRVRRSKTAGEGKGLNRLIAEKRRVEAGSKAKKILQHEELLKSRLMVGNLKWLCYLLSTSVYSNCGGMWVAEE